MAHEFHLKRLESAQKLGWPWSKVNARFPTPIKVGGAKEWVVGEAQVRKSALLQGRVEVLFRLARYDLSFPFAALCVATALLQTDANPTYVALPFVAYIGA